MPKIYLTGCSTYWMTVLMLPADARGAHMGAHQQRAAYCTARPYEVRRGATAATHRLLKHDVAVLLVPARYHARLGHGCAHAKRDGECEPRQSDE